MPRRAIGRHVAVLSAVYLRDFTPLELRRASLAQHISGGRVQLASPLGSAQLSSAASRRIEDGDRRVGSDLVGPQTLTARQPLPPGGDGRGVSGRAARSGRVRDLVAGFSGFPLIQDSVGVCSG